jgi:hypothetical protein
MGVIEADTAKAASRDGWQRAAHWSTLRCHGGLVAAISTSIGRLWLVYDTAFKRSPASVSARYNVAAARAYLSLARHDTVGALREFTALSDTSCLRCDLDQLTTAQLLAGAHRYAEADKILRQRLFSSITPTEIAMALERGKVGNSFG